MRRITKNCLGLVLSLGMSVSLFGCGEKQKDEIPDVGILQFVAASALNSANEGFHSALIEDGYVDGMNIRIHFECAEGSTADSATIAKKLVRDNDLVLGIATPAATALYSAAKVQGADTKILFTAVTDPVDAKLVNSIAAPGGNVTGTSDMNPVALQIDVLKEIIPDIKKFGIIYTVSETNSKIQADLAKKQADEMGIECIINTISDSSEISSVTRSLITNGAQVIYVPTDNKISDSITSVTRIAYEYNVPVACAEEGMVIEGGTFAIGINYYNLGYLTGQMAIEILNGKDPATMPVGYLDASQYSLAVNEKALEQIGLTIPESLREKYK